MPKLAKAAAAESFFAPASALVSAAPGAIFRAIKAGSTAEDIVKETCDTLEAGVPLDAVALPQDVHLEDGLVEPSLSGTGGGSSAAASGAGDGSSGAPSVGASAPAGELARATTAASESSDMVAPDTRSSSGVRAIALAATAELIRRATRDHTLVRKCLQAAAL